jgi:hypothetical protein
MPPGWHPAGPAGAHADCAGCIDAADLWCLDPESPSEIGLVFGRGPRRNHLDVADAPGTIRPGRAVVHHRVGALEIAGVVGVPAAPASTPAGAPREQARKQTCPRDATDTPSAGRPAPISPAALPPHRIEASPPCCGQTSAPCRNALLTKQMQAMYRTASPYRAGRDRRSARSETKRIPALLSGDGARNPTCGGEFPPNSDAVRRSNMEKLFPTPPRRSARIATP